MMNGVFQTSTVPCPQLAFHSPPEKLIQLRSPHGPFPTLIRGLSCTEIRKSSSSFGIGRSMSEAFEDKGKEVLVEDMGMRV